MKVTSTRFGEIEVGPDDVIHFSQGILGFEALRDYALIMQDRANPFFFMQSLDDPDLTFVVIDPLWVRPDYKVRVREEDLEKIDAQEDDAVAVYAIVTVPKDPQEMTVNLVAPLLINSRTRLGLQHVQSDAPYQIRHRIQDELARRRQLEQKRQGEGAAHAGLPESVSGEQGQAVPLQKVV